MSNESSISDIKTSDLTVSSSERREKKRRLAEGPDEDDPSNEEEIDPAQLRSAISSIQDEMKHLQELMGIAQKEKDQLQTEKDQLQTEKVELQTFKDELMSEKNQIKNLMNELTEAKRKAKALQALDDVIMPSQDQLPDALMLLSDEPNVTTRKLKISEFIETTNGHIFDCENIIAKTDDHIAKTNRFIEGKKRRLEHLNKRLRLLKAKKDKMETLIERDILTDAAKRNDPEAGLLYVQQCHRISVSKNSTINIGMLDRLEGFSSNRSIFIPKTFQKLAIRDDMIKAWKVVKNEALTNEDFINQLVELLEGLEKSIVKSAWQSCQIEFPSKDVDSMGEMALQQFVYPPFAYLFKAAAGIHSEKYYKANEPVKSSLTVQYKQKEEDPEPEQKKISIKPDGAVVLHEDGWDAFGMMEIKPRKPSCDHDHLMDYDKCALVTIITALATKRAMLEQNDDRYHMVAIPFIIATGKKCSLYATTLDANGNPCIREVQYPDGGNARDRTFDSATCIDRKKMFTALAVLLSRFKTFFNGFKKGNNDLVTKRTRAFGIIPTLNLSTKSKDTKSRSAKSESSDNNQGKGTSDEDDAKEAAAFGGKFVNVQYPYLKTIWFNDNSDEEDEQTHSPFFFVGDLAPMPTGGDMTTMKVFLKVWKAEDVKTRSVETEWKHYKQAYDAGVPVAIPALLEVARSTSSRGSQYLIIAVEYIHQDTIKNVEDLVQFCHSLVDTVEKLHKQAKLLHCDLKPDNVRWRDGIVHLIDFEHAQPIGSARSRRSTEGFEAPEILKAMPCSTLTDAFSVGKTILCTLERLNDTTNPQSQSYGMLHDIAVKLTDPDAKLRWNLTQASVKIKEFTTPQNSHSFSSIQSESKVANPVAASPNRIQSKMESQSTRNMQDTIND